MPLYLVAKRNFILQKFRRKIKLKKNNIDWENAKGECFCNTHLKMHEKKLI